MKKISIILMFLLPAFVFAQNWSPIRVNQKMNYQHSDSSYISHTIWVDSAIVEGADSVFFTNRIVKDVPGNPEIVLRNQPQFFGKFLVKQQYGFYLIGEPYNYTIYAYADLGESWSFTGTSGISAEVTSLFTESVFGVTDSVKVISLSDGNEIRLSKNFGILQFPDFENVGYYELVGIQATEFGESVPGFWEFYDFEVGDVFQYQTSGYIADQWVYHYVHTRKFEITGKEVFEDSVHYNYSGILHSMGWSKSEYSDTISGVIAYVNTPTDFSNLFPNELVQFEDYNAWSSWDSPVFAKVQIYKIEENNNVIKLIGHLFGDPGIGKLYAEFGAESDSMHAYKPWELFDEPAEDKNFMYSENLGLVRHDKGFFEYEETHFLEGYIKNGDTVGTITPDSVLWVGIKKPVFTVSPVQIYPNPASTVLNIKIERLQKAEYQFELRNNLGQMVKKTEFRSPGKSINIAELQSGIYFYAIKYKMQNIKTGKLMIR